MLVVSSDVEQAHTLVDGLKDYEWSGHIESSAEDALCALRTSSFDAVIADMKLPEMSGAQLVQAAFRMHPQLIALVMVGQGESVLARSATASGVCELISRDASMEFVIMAMERLMGRREAARKALWQHTRDVLLNLLKSIAAAIDAKSEYAAMHSRRVAQICVQVTPYMELTEYEAKTLELAAHVHDFGKIGTPDDVLTKPGRLNDEEWVDVLKHPAFGSIIFAEIEELADVAAAIRHHHEHYDGSGYPDGLVGDAVPKLAKILAVADAYEAMTSLRPYRPALSHNDALYELQMNAGSQFDPWVVDRFLQAMVEPEVELEKRVA